MTLEPHNMVGAYALDALDDDERAEFEAHVDRCPECTDELVGFLETASRLGATTEGAPPAHLRGQVLAAATRTPQERPVVLPLSRRGRTRRIVSRVGLAAAAMALVATGGLAVVEHNQAEEGERDLAGISDVISADDATMKSTQVGDDGTAKLVMSKDLDRAVLVVKNLPKLQRDRVYQMWTIADGKAESAGVISASDSTGSSSHMMSGVSGVGAVAITVEPDGGSEKPTTKPITQIST